MSAAAASPDANNDWCPCDALCSLVSENPTCSSSESSCSQHACYPAAIMSKIDWEESMADSVKAHSVHLLIAQGSDANKWPEEVTDPKGSYARELDKALSDAKSSLPCKIRLSLSDAPSFDEHNQPVLFDPEAEKHDPHYACDILIFPAMIRVLHVKKSEVAKFVEQLAQFLKEVIAAKKKNGTTPAAAATSTPSAESSSSSSSSSSAATNGVVFPARNAPLPGTSFLICAHKQRDKRCGVTGPILCEEIDKIIAESYPSSPTPFPIHSYKVSHIGGHKFAGNLIAYPAGIWYGKVLPCHVPHILLAHCKDFVLVDSSSGERKEIKVGGETSVEAELQKLKPLIRGSVNPL